LTATPASTRSLNRSPNRTQSSENDTVAATSQSRVLRRPCEPASRMTGRRLRHFAVTLAECGQVLLFRGPARGYPANLNVGHTGRLPRSRSEWIVVRWHLRVAAGVCVLAAGLLMGGGAVAVAVPGLGGSSPNGDDGTNDSVQGPQRQAALSATLLTMCGRRFKA
jgi:hypothetical protein